MSRRMEYGELRRQVEPLVRRGLRNIEIIASLPHCKPVSVTSTASVLRRKFGFHADPEFKAKRRAGRWGDFEVPAWVERAGLTNEFIDIARCSGEFDAARHCRRLLALDRAP